MKIVLILVLFSHMLYAQPGARKLVWHENFSSDKLDEKVWNFELGDGCPNLCGWGNNELQIYTKNNHFLRNGKLYINVKKDADRYASTKITTRSKKEFQYGYIEIKAKLPTAVGLWPAFWMLGNDINEVGWPKCGEIDILEYVGREPHTIFTTLHTQDSHGNSINSKKSIFTNIEQGYHLFAVDWTADKIDFFVDNSLVYSFRPSEKTKNTYPFTKPFYFIINVAVGGNLGGNIVNDAILPQQFIIDHIKVFQ